MSYICKECGKKIPVEREGYAQICSECRKFNEQYQRGIGIRIVEHTEQEREK